MTDSSAFLPHNRRRQELCGPGPGCGKTNSRSPRWDPSAITSVSSRPPHDVATPRYAPPRATSPRCYARCSEVSLRDPGIRPRCACSAGRPAPRCCKAPRPHRHPRPVCCWGKAMPTVRITRRSAHDRRSAGGANGAQVELAEGYAPDRRRPSRSDRALAAGNAVYGLTAHISSGPPRMRPGLGFCMPPPKLPTPRPAVPIRRSGRCEEDAARYAPSPCWLQPQDRCPHMRLGCQPGFGVRAVSPQAGCPREQSVKDQVPGDGRRLGQVARDHLPWRRVSVLMVTSGYDHRVRICLDWRALARWRGERR